MTIPWRKLLRIEALLLLLLVYPFLPFVEHELFQLTGRSIGAEMTTIFIFALLALGLNVVVGNTGLLHLGIGAFFGIGAYTTGILTVPSYPFQTGFILALAISTLMAGLAGVVLGAPTLRLRGDYLALVTLGFGEVVRFSMRNLEEITGGTKGLNPVPAPGMPEWFASALESIGWKVDWSTDFRLFYFLTFGILLLVMLLLRNLEKSRIGRAFVAIREDELAATCMGINSARIKLTAFALGAALAGLAGCLYATKLTTTGDPDVYNFNRSIIMLCCIILGGLGSLRGTVLGVFLLVGFDNILAPVLDDQIQRAVQWLKEHHEIDLTGNRFLAFRNWKLMIYGLALILMMRFRPEGLLPSLRVREELHEEQEAPTGLVPRQSARISEKAKPKSIAADKGPEGNARP